MLSRNKKVSGISCGGLHNAAVTEDGLVYTWGCSDDGSLGRDGEETLPLLVQGGGLEAQTVIAVACGDGQTLALSASGDVFGWGCYKDKEGQKWFNPTPECAVPSRDVQKQQNTPIKITGLSDVVEVACGSGFNIARCSNGNIFSWGIGECGELGRDVCPLKKPYDVDGVYSSHITPGPMRDAKGAVVRNAKAIGCGAYHSLVVVIDEAVGGSKLLTCGLNNYGQLGHGDTKNLPRLEEVTALSGKGIVSVKGGFHHSLVLSATGDMFAFGRGDSGQVNTSLACKRC
jgi:regulator of chromosome condensation